MFFLSANFSAHVAKKQQKLPISATNVVFGFRSIFKGLMNAFVEENNGFEGRTPLCLGDTGNKTQKCSESRFQDCSAVLEGVTSPTSDHDAHFANFRGKVTFSKSSTFWRWKRLSRGTGNPPKNILEFWIFFQQHFIPNVAEKNFVADCGPPSRWKTAFSQF